MNGMYFAVDYRFYQHRYTNGMNACDCPHALRVKTQFQISKFYRVLQRDSITLSGCYTKVLKNAILEKKKREKRPLKFMNLFHNH